MTAPLKRPFLVTLLALGVLFLTLLNGVRFGSTLIKWDLLISFAPRPGPLYIAATGLVWTIGGLTVYLGLWLGQTWARSATVGFSGLYAAYYWFDRLIFQSAVPRENWRFALSATITLLLFTAVTLFVPGSRKFFNQREKYDR